MTDLILEPFREAASEKEISEMLRKEACQIRGYQTHTAMSARDIAPKRKGRFSILAGWFLRLSFRALQP